MSSTTATDPTTIVQVDPATTPVDPLSWISSERQIVADSLAAAAQLEADLSSSVAELISQIQAEQASEAQFTNDLATLTASVSSAAIAQTIQDLTTTSANVDSAFSQLQTVVQQNNQAAGNVVQQINAVAPYVQQINAGRAALDARIANYKNVISTFRNYQAAAPAAPVPPVALADPVTPSQ